MKKSITAGPKQYQQHFAFFELWNFELWNFLLGTVGILIAVGQWDNPDIPTRTYGISEGDDHTKELSEAVTSAICRNHF